MTFLKILLIGAGVAIAIVVAGLTGVLFELWPTFLGDRTLLVNEEVLGELREFKDTPKFLPADIFYPGARDEVVRQDAQRLVDELTQRLIVGLPQHPRRSFVLSEFKTTLRRFNDFDSEERDQAGHCLERIMHILGIESSGRLISVWRYGLPLG